MHEKETMEHNLDLKQFVGLGTREEINLIACKLSTFDMDLTDSLK